ncbi:MAG TPA: CBS domain-containing protein [Pseudomonadales bacterium]|nr:CBS domain-containing protein [Pseudomonadales bacterium]
MFQSTRVSDHMLVKPVLVTPETDLFEAIHQILVNRISGLTVVDDQRRPVGVLSELDCLKAILTGTYYQMVGGRVSDYMTKGVIDVISPDDDILSVAQSMIDKKRRRRPVVNAEGVLVGQVTCRQLLRALKEMDMPPDPTEHGHR